jgi:hypothetical protein
MASHLLVIRTVLHEVIAVLEHALVEVLLALPKGFGLLLLHVQDVLLHIAERLLRHLDQLSLSVFEDDEIVWDLDILLEQ